MDINAIEDALIAYASEAKRPLAALHSLGARHALNTRIDVIRIERTGRSYLSAYSEGGEWRGRQWQILLPIDANLTPDLCGEGDGIVVTSSGDRTGRYTYTMHRELVAYYMRGAIAKYGEYLAVTKLGEPSIELGTYLDPTPRREFAHYFDLGFDGLRINGATYSGQAPSFRTWHQPQFQPTASEDGLADWELELIAAEA